MIKTTLFNLKFMAVVAVVGCTVGGGVLYVSTRNQPDDGASTQSSVTTPQQTATSVPAPALFADATTVDTTASIVSSSDSSARLRAAETDKDEEKPSEIFSNLVSGILDLPPVAEPSAKKTAQTGAVQPNKASAATSSRVVTAPAVQPVKNMPAPSNAAPAPVSVPVTPAAPPVVQPSSPAIPPSTSSTNSASNAPPTTLPAVPAMPVSDTTIPTSAPVDFSQTNAQSSAQPAWQNLPIDVREITFPSDMTAWGWMDVTKNGAQVLTGATPNPGCPDALPNLTDVASVSQTTQAIQCRLNNLGFNGNSGSLFFPAGTYYINQTLSIRNGQWSQNQNGSYTFTYFGGGNRSNYTGDMHISGQDPATTKIVWAGSCATDPNIANPGAITKYNDMFYVNGGGTPFVMERLTLDGNQSCAGSGIDFVSKPSNMSGIDIHEMNIHDFRQVGIVGDRPSMTIEELNISGTDSNGNPYSEADTTGMISEVTISQVSLSNVGYACIMVDAPNVVDWWIRDSRFDHCNIGITNTSYGVSGDWWPLPHTAALPWGPGNPGGFEVANSIFTNSQTVDILGGNAVRNSYSLASNGPFIEETGNFLAVGNTVVASNSVIPVVGAGGQYGTQLAQLILLQNQFVTQNNQPAILINTLKEVYNPYYAGANPILGNLANETYADIASIGNKFTSTKPFANASLAQVSQDTNGLSDIPGWAANTSVLWQCGPLGGLLTPYDNRTYCTHIQQDSSPVFNLVTLGDQLGATITPSEPALPPVRPIVQRNYIVVSLDQSNSQAAATSNSTIIQNALNTLAANQSRCGAYNYTCPDRWGILYLPSGNFPIAATIDVPGSVQLQIVGTGDSNFYWFWNTYGWGGSPAQPPYPISGMFKFHAPSHAMLRDIGIYGQADSNFPNALGEGLVAEVTDLDTSRVVTDKLNILGSFSATGIGNAAFQMKSFGNGQGANTITGNNAQNDGYFAFFTGNPSNLTVGHGANLMIQDTWYEGNNSNYVTCASGEDANITIESSNISMASWHSTASSASNLTTFNVAGCKTKTAIISDNIGRQVCGAPGTFPYYPGFAGGCFAPAPNMILPAGTPSTTEVLFLGDSTINSTYADSYGETTNAVVPSNFAGTLNQGYAQVDPASQAQYGDFLGIFFQHFADIQSPSDYIQLAATNTGNASKTFMNSVLGQALDPRMVSSLPITPPITDTQSTDLLFQHVMINGTKMDLQFVVPNAATQ